MRPVVSFPRLCLQRGRSCFDLRESRRAKQSRPEYLSRQQNMSEIKSKSDGHSEIARVFQALPERFKPGRVDKTLVYHFEIDDEKWTVRVGPENCEVTEGKPESDADCFLKTTKEIVIKTFRGDYTPSFMDLMSGKISTNNPGLLLVFKQVFG